MTSSEGILDLCQSSMHFCCPEESHTHLAHVQALLCLVVPCVDDSQVLVNDDDVYQLPGAAETPLPGFYHLGPCCSVSAAEICTENKKVNKQQPTLEIAFQLIKEEATSIDLMLGTFTYRKVRPGSFWPCPTLRKELLRKIPGLMLVRVNKCPERHELGR